MNGNNRASVAILILRVGLGLILLYFGAQKVLGLFGGQGPHATIQEFHDSMGIPVPFTLLAMTAEFLGGLGIIFGFLTPIAAFGTACTMAVATYENCKQPGALDSLTHGGGPGAMSIFLTSLLLVGSLSVMIMGAGTYSLDSKLFIQRKGRR